MFVIAFLKSEDCRDNVSQEANPPRSRNVGFRRPPPWSQRVVVATPPSTDKQPWQPIKVPLVKKDYGKKEHYDATNVVTIQSSVVKLWKRVTAAIGCGYRRLVDGRIVGFAGT